MSPARRTRLTSLKNEKKVRNRLRRILFLAGLMGLLVLLFTYSTHFRGQEKLTIVSPTSDGDIQVTTFDRGRGEVTSVRIPADTEVTLARQLGTWRLRSVWQLGVNEDIGGKLLAETVTKNFKFPVYAWTDIQGSALIGTDLISKTKAIFYPYDTNLGFGDKVTLALSSLGIKNSDRLEVDLTETTYLKKTKLKDGNEGYLISGRMPQNLIVVFAEAEMTDDEVIIILKNFSGSKSLSNQVAGVLEVLGGKVAANIDELEDDRDCEVMAKKDVLAQKISSLFNCQILTGLPEGNFDLELRVGQRFAKRF